MAVYDSAKSRNAGRLVRQMALTMDDNVLPMMREASQGMEGLQGKAAQAMEEQTAQLLGTADAIHAALEELSRQMNTYADMLERADEELAEKL